MNDPFSEFRSAVSKYFVPVAEHFALPTVVDREISYQLFIDFRGPTGMLTVAHELGGGSWVYVTVPTASGHERQFGLHTIVEAQERSRNSFDDLSKLNGVDAEVRALADLARKHAGILLRERTANIRELYLLSEKVLRERESGEIAKAKAAYRPSLRELFRACRPDQRPICVYHAVVDYSYSHGEVATFLEIGPAEVQSIVTNHDTIRGRSPAAG